MKVSAIMPTYNRGHLLVWSLPSLLNQTRPPDEIIIVDDGSTDKTEGIVKEFQKEHPEANIRYAFNDNPGWTICCHAMNVAIQMAQGDILLLTEPEVLHPITKEIEIILKYFSGLDNDKTILIANPLYCVYQIALYKLTLEQLLNPISILSQPNIHKWYNGYISPDDTITFFSRGGTHHIAAILKKHVKEIGGYDEGFMIESKGENGEVGYGHVASGYDDIDFLTRLRHYGVNEVRSDEIVAIHLDHGPPPSYVQNEELKKINFERMQARKPEDWEVNKGREWGVLKK